MNTKKLTGTVIWLLAVIPLHYCLLAAEHSSNRTGVISLVTLVAMIFIGYAYFDAGVKHGHDATEGGHGH